MPVTKILDYCRQEKVPNVPVSSGAGGGGGPLGSPRAVVHVAVTIQRSETVASAINRRRTRAALVPAVAGTTAVHRRPAATAVRQHRGDEVGGHVVAGGVQLPPAGTGGTPALHRPLDQGASEPGPGLGLVDGDDEARRRVGVHGLLLLGCLLWSASTAGRPRLTGHWNGTVAVIARRPW